MATRNFNVKNGLTVGNITLDVSTNTANVPNLLVTGTANFTGASNVSLGSNSNVKITGGTAGYVLSTDGAGNLSWAAASTATAAGANTQIQFNDAGSFGASANFTFNKSTNLFTVTGNANVGNLNSSGRVRAVENVLIDGGSSEGGQLVIGWTGITGITGQANSTWNLDSDGSNNFRFFYQNAAGGTGVAMTLYSANANVQVNTNLLVTNGVTASTLTSNVATGTAPFAVSSTTRVANLNVANAGFADAATSATNAAAVQSNTSTSATAYLLTTATSGNANVSLEKVTGIFANLANNSITATTFVGTITSATNASAVLTNTSTNTQVYLTGTQTAGNANVSLEKVTGIYANMSNNSITATTFVGSLSGTATSALSATNAAAVQSNTSTTNTVYLLGTQTAANGNVSLEKVSGITANFAANSITATTFNGNLVASAANGVIFGNNHTASGAASGNINMTTITGNLGIRALASTYTDNVAAAGTIANAAIHAIAAPTVAASNNITTTNLATFYIANAPTASTNVTITNGYALYVAAGNSLFTANVTAGNFTTAGQLVATGNVVSSANLVSNDIIGRTGALTIKSAGTNTNINLQPNGTGNVDVNSAFITNVKNPTNLQDAATKSYVDSLVSTGIQVHPAVGAATTTTLATATGGTITYNNGAAGVGANLVTTGSFNLIDTANVQTVGTRILVKNETNAAHNGVYTWANATTIVRSTDTDTYAAADPDALGQNDYFFVSGGSVNKDTSWICSTPGTITFGTTAINFSQFSATQAYSAGTGLSLSSALVFSIANTSVTAGSYGNGDRVATFTVNAQGQLTAAANVAITSNAANLTGTTLASTVVSSSLTSVGTLTSLSVTGNASAGNINTAGKVVASTLESNVATGTAPLVVTSTTRVANLNVANAGFADAATSATNAAAVQSNTSTTNTVYLLGTGTAANGNVSLEKVTGITANYAANTITATQFIGTHVGNVVANVANGTVIANNHTASGAATGNANVATITGNLGIRALFSTYTDNSAAASATIANAAIHALAAPNLAAANATVTFTNAATFYIAGAPVANTNATITNPYALYVGTGNSLFNGNVTVGNIIGNGQALTAINGANVTGTVSSATTAGTVTANAQGNITSVGTLTSLTVDGNLTLGGNVNLIDNLSVNGFLGANGDAEQGGIIQIIGGNGGATGNTLGGSVSLVGGSATVGGNVTLSPGSGVGTDKQGGWTIIRGGVSTGSAQPGNIVFQTTTPTTSGATNQTLANRIVISGNVVNVTTSVAATSTTSGALVVVGGMGVAGNVYAGAFYGAATGLTSIPGGNVTGTVPSATSATNAAAVQSNTSTSATTYLLSTATAGNANVSLEKVSGITANLANNSITATTFVGTLSGSSTSATNAAAVQSNTSTNNTVYLLSTATAGNANVSLEKVAGITANLANNSITATTFVGSLSGAATSATSATNAAAVQSNTSTNNTVYLLGTATAANGNVSLEKVSGITANYAANTITATQFNGNIVGTSVVANGSNGVLFGNNHTASGAGTGNANVATITGNLGIRALFSTYTDNSAAASATIANAAIHALAAPNLAAANATVTFTNAATFYIAGAPVANGTTITNPYALYVGSGNSLFSGNVTVGNIIGNGQALTGLNAANLSGTLPNAVTNNITNVGTITSGTWNSTFTAGLNANTLANIQGGNVSGAVASATSATNAAAVQSNTTTNNTVYLLGTATAANGNVSLEKVTGITANFAANSITATTFNGNVVGSNGTFTYVRTTGNTGVTLQILGGVQNTANTAGGGIQVIGATGNGSGAGGLVQLAGGAADISGGAGVGNGVGGAISIAGGSGWAGGTGGNVTISSGASDGYGSNIILGGAGNTTSGAGGTVTVNGGLANGTNKVGGAITIAGGRGTGTGQPGNIVFQTPDTTTSGSTAQTLANRIVISGNVVNVTTSVAATSTTSGALVVVGGMGVAGNVYAGAFYGAATGLTSIPGANVTGAVGSATNAAAVQSNTSTSTTAYLLTTATAGNANVSLEKVTGIFANLANNSITATTFVGTITSATNASAVLTNTSTNTQVYLTGTQTAGNANVSLEKVTGIYANMSNNSITATTFVGSLSGAATSATSATNAAAVQSNTSTSTTAYLLTTATAGNANVSLEKVAGITANLANNSITATTFVGSLSGAATSATSATNAAAVQSNTSTNNTVYLLGTQTAANGNVSLEKVTGITANFAANSITATTFNGNVIANAANGVIFGNNHTASGAATGNFNVSTITGNLGIRALASTYTDNVAAAGTVANAAIHAIATPTLTAANAITTTNAATFYIANAPAASTNVTITNGYALYVGAGNSLFAATVTAGNLSTGGTLSVTGNANVGNLGTAGLITATGNVSGGNLTTTGALSVTGNANVGNLGTAGIITATGNITSSANLISDNILGRTGALTITSAGTNTNINLKPNGTGNIDANSTFITNVKDPSNPQDAATKAYVDGIAQGLNVHDSCYAATANTLAILTGGTITYNNGSSGVGANLTLGGTPTKGFLTANTFDGNTTAVVSNRILVKNEANAVLNGIYTVTSNTVLTRATDYDSVPEVEAGDFVFVTDGDLYNDTGWVQTSTVTGIGTAGNNISFTQFSGAGTYTAGTGLTLTGTVFSVNASQTQITSVGTLGTLSVNGNANVGNIGAATGVFTAAVTASGANGVIFANSHTASGAMSGNINVATVTGNLGIRALASTYTDNVAAAGTIGNAAIHAIAAPTVAASNSITTTNLATFYIANAPAASTNVTITNGYALYVGAGNSLFNGNVTVGNIIGNGQALTAINGSNVTGQVSNALVAGTVYTAAQPNITSVSTSFAGLTFAANGNITMSGSASQLSGANLVSATLLTGTLTTAAQGNITSVGTLTSLTVSGNANFDSGTLFVDSVNNRVGVNTSSPAFALEVSGSFAATTKSFVIDHPTKDGMKLRYGSLEGPENGVYVRGKLKGSNTIVLPDYWTGLVDEETITVNLTPIGKHQKLYVIDIVNNSIIIGNDKLLNKEINCFYTVFAERKDVDKLESEIWKN